MTCRRILLLCTAFALSQSILSARDARWIRMKSPNFEFYSSAGEGTTRDALVYFEQVRSFFLQTMGSGIGDAAPITLVAFGSKKEYEPYRFNEFAAAYYFQSGERDYIVLSDAGVSTFPTAVHEYVHFVVRRQKLDLPPWLNEGTAELYSTLKPLGDKILVGSLIPGRRQGLLLDKWVPLSTIVAVDRKSPYYNEKAKAGSFYNESWALVHMLALGELYHSGYQKVMAAIAKGQSSEDALTQTYGKSIQAIDKDLQAYIRGDRFQAALFPVKMAKVAAEKNAETAPEFDVRLTLAQLLTQPGKENEVRKEFEALAALDPKRPEPCSELGYLAWRQGKLEEARKYYREAFDRGGRNPKMLWDYGRLAEREPAQSIRVLNELLALEPARVDVRIELAAVNLNAKQAKEALLALAPIKTIDRPNAPRFFMLMAHAQLQAGNRAEALEAGHRWQQVAKTDADQSDVLNFLAYLEHPAAATPPPPVAPASDDNDPNDTLPVVQRRDVSRPVREVIPNRLEAEGSFTQLECISKQARVILQSPQGKLVFLIEDPDKVLVLGKDGATIEMSCGAQKNPAKVRIVYQPPSQPGLNGLLREIHFLP